MDDAAELTGVSWWMDLALFQELGIPCVVFGPSGEGLHAAIEYVDFDSVIDTARIIANTVVSYCK